MADYGIHKYRLGNALLCHGLIEGMTLEGNRLSVTSGNSHCVFLPGLDSAQPGCKWGRLSMISQLGPESMLTVRVFAADQNTIQYHNDVLEITDLLLDASVPVSDKEKLFSLANGMEHSGASDILLEHQEGRWLWLWLEITGRAGDYMEDIRVYVPGDHFFHTLPQVYQEDNSFLKRYLSIFSTMFQEFQEEIDRLPENLDVDYAPEPLLPVFASWLGLDVDEALFTSDEIRSLLRIAPQLMARKGTRWAIETAISLFIPHKIYVVERNQLQSNSKSVDEIYGTTPYDFTILVDQSVTEKTRRRIQFLADQFKPVRSRYQVVFLRDCGGLDGFTYLDINGTVLQNRPGNLDDGDALTGMTYLT